uniref:Cytochrome c oxidase assembly protein CtaG n=1 Tax=Chromera velia CCMP2878 TaxID=1169474 RepID=A0A0G4FUZ4_9ALVE|eukprot:Cvel_18776.t1-p1 / transcript=Cvel_18776.t1 / gene=Cvel_18776 / organism=Chromera_velia_CCMP2878 / gene_product=Cytochrome c oxidase assembly protein COX11,, putative / transcript_product=Cytochrome c oxidase assembly protein COX11,, putative / location=Cvel_scaffold1576:6639-9468(-) / protein_length=200 / sequence_SO=supercontig / SO=protein_coding / is_pseudo=false
MSRPIQIAIALLLFSFGLSFASLPLYKVFCQATGFNGTTMVHKDYAPPPEQTSRAAKRLITVEFSATTIGSLMWDFKPCQRKIVVTPGETALAFYKAKNLTHKPVIGMALYNVMPPEVGLYFNKIQCFCFEEQMLNPQEEVDMPVFFFLDPEYADDPRLRYVDKITLSYVFFESNSDIPEQYKQLYQMAMPTSRPPPQPV